MRVPARLSGGENFSGLRPWLNALRDCVQAIQLKGDGRTTLITETPNGTTIRFIGTSGGGSGGGGSYAGEWAVISAGAGKIKIQDVIPNTLILGIERIVIDESEELSVSGTGYVYLQVTYSSEYVVSVHFGSFPAQTNDNVYFPLAYVFEGKIYQIQYGSIIQTGRIY